MFVKNSTGIKRTSKLPCEKSHIRLCDTKINLHAGGACRTRVNKVLSVRFQSPLIAEKFFQGANVTQVVHPKCLQKTEEDVSSTASIDLITVE